MSDPILPAENQPMPKAISVTMLQRILMPGSETGSTISREFGKNFHSYMLEGKWSEEPETSVKQKLLKMKDSLTRAGFNAADFPRREVEHYWYLEHDSGLSARCKGRFDAFSPTDKLIVDLKTTSAKNIQEVHDKMRASFIYLQAFWYLFGMINVEQMDFYFVQKMAPFTTFKVSCTLNDPEVQEAGKYAGQLINEIAAKPEYSDFFVNAKRK